MKEKITLKTYMSFLKIGKHNSKTELRLYLPGDKNDPRPEEILSVVNVGQLNSLNKEDKKKVLAVINKYQFNYIGSLAHTVQKEYDEETGLSLGKSHAVIKVMLTHNKEEKNNGKHTN